MDKLLEQATTYWEALVHYPRVEIFGVLAFSVLVPVVALACIYLRDHFRNGHGVPEPED